MQNNKLFEQSKLTSELEMEFEQNLVDPTQNFAKPIKMDELWEMNIHQSEFDDETQATIMKNKQQLLN